MKRQRFAGTMEFTAEGFDTFNLVGQRAPVSHASGPAEPVASDSLARSTLPAILQGYDAPRDQRPDVDDMTAADMRAELAAHGFDDAALDRLPNWPALAGAVRRIRRP